MARPKTQAASRPARSSDLEVFGSAAVLPESVARLALAARVAAAPAAKIRMNLIARIRAEPKSPAVPAGWRFESARLAGGWVKAFPGVRFKALSVDKVRDVALVLMEMAPGAQFPDHQHSGTPEEGLVISGDLLSGGRRLSVGDYYYAEEGTEHTHVTSPSGCTALLSLRAAVWQQFRASLAK